MIPAAPPISRRPERGAAPTAPVWTFARSRTYGQRVRASRSFSESD